MARDDSRTREERWMELITAPVVQERLTPIFAPIFVGGVALMLLVGAAVNPLVPVPLYLGASLLLWCLAFRFARGGIVCLGEGVRVRNLHRTTRLYRWSEVAGCEIGTWLRSREWGFLVLESGERIVVHMLGLPYLELGIDKVRERIDEFNGLVQAKRTAGERAPG